MWWAYGFWSAFSELLCALGFVLTDIWWAFGTLSFIDSLGRGHLVGIWCSIGGLLVRLHFIVFFRECEHVILVPCWWWLMWAFGGLLPVHVLGGHLVSFC